MQEKFFIITSVQLVFPFSGGRHRHVELLIEFSFIMCEYPPENNKVL
jgi:hypothetical protein